MQVEVTVENVVRGAGGEDPAPSNGGLWVMRPWFGFHDGSYTTFTVGQPAATGVEHEAEDGFIGDISNTTIPPDGVANYGNGPRQFQLFAQQPGASTVQGSLGGPLAPGLVAKRIFIVDPADPKSRYLSYISMVIPSNDAFFGNEDPKAYPVFDAAGKFLGPITIAVHGSDILDAGTEVNSELPADTAFFGQSVGDFGTPENGVIHVHPGFNHPASGGILKGGNQFPPGGPMNSFQNADFKLPGYEVAKITIALPAPPVLSIKRTGDNYVISWPADRTLYVLEIANSLPASAWTRVAGVAKNSITFKAPSRTQFYRLVRR